VPDIEQIRFAIMTVKREPSYIHQTLAGFFASGPPLDCIQPIELMLGTNEHAYLDAYKDSSLIQINRLTNQQWRMIEPWGVHRRFAFNLARSIRMGLHSTQGLCVCEDDVIFRDGFVDKLLRVVNQIEQKRDRYVLACYAAYDFVNHSNNAGDLLYCDYPSGFYGTQCMYYPRNVVEELSDYIWKHGVETPEETGDLLIGRYPRKFHPRKLLLASRWSLVQHIGQHTSGLGNFHTTPTFDMSFPSERKTVTYTLPAEPPPPPPEEGGIDEQNAREIADRFLEQAPQYPADNFRGRGVVICGGGVEYFTCAWLCIHMLRNLGCRLPIELWHLDGKEMSTEMRELVAPLNVTCVNAAEVQRRHPVRRLTGWELKPYSVIHSSFKEALYLDADNVPVVDPTFLFDSPEYKQTGAVFWPDYGRLEPHRAIWRVCKVLYRDEPEFESGQMLIDKQRCWQALQLTMHLNEHSDFYYHYIHGDKDTYHMAWRMLNQPYGMVPHRIKRLGLPRHRHWSLVMCQHDFEGKVIFQHRNQSKWKLVEANDRIPGFQYETECLEFLDELREKWSVARKMVASHRKRKRMKVRQVGRRFVRSAV